VTLDAARVSESGTDSIARKSHPTCQDDRNGPSLLAGWSLMSCRNVAVSACAPPCGTHRPDRRTDLADEVIHRHPLRQWFHRVPTAGQAGPGQV